MELEEVLSAVRGLRNMTPEQGRRIYDHVIAARPHEILELGTSYGVSAAYMAAALDANGDGRITTVDHVQSNSPDELLSRLDPRVADRIEFVRIPDSSYTWWLKKQVAARSDAAGNCEPRYDFVFLDGAHNWTVDGLSVVLIERLLCPGGWLLLDDLNWVARSDPHGMRERGVFFPLSEEERNEPHVREVFELLVRPSVAFAEMRVEDDVWAWARKDTAPQRRVTVTTTRSPAMLLATLVLRATQLINVSLLLKREQLHRGKGDRELIEKEIEERAQELARLRWVDEGYGGSSGRTDDS